jgi:hypothetical protein
MDGFKNNTKMQCFKEGGSVKYESRKGHKEEMSADMSQDKAMIKKGVKQHESALHKGQPKTELKLKTGGRAKKDCGTVKKYKVGGTVENTYGTPMSKKDIKNVDKTKMQKPKMLCGGGSMGKYAAGGKVEEKLKDLEEQRALEKMARAKKYLGPSQQSELIKQSPAAAGLSGTPAATVKRPLPTSSNIGAADMGAGSQDAAMPGAMKKGGKAKKYAEGGSLKETNAEENPGLAKLPTNVRNKMGYMRKGGKAC